MAFAASTVSSTEQQAQNVHQRSMRETMILEDEVFQDKSPNNKATAASSDSTTATRTTTTASVLKNTEVGRWGDSFGGEVWMNSGSIEATMPKPNTQRVRSSDE